MNSSVSGWFNVWIGLEKSIAALFPPSEDPLNEYYARLATRELGELAFNQGDYVGAMEHFTELADLDDTETDLKAFGLVGQANVLAAEGKLDEAKYTLALVGDLFKSMPDVNKRLDVIQRVSAELQGQIPSTIGVEAPPEGEGRRQ